MTKNSPVSGFLLKVYIKSKSSAIFSEAITTFYPLSNFTELPKYYFCLSPQNQDKQASIILGF